MNSYTILAKYYDKLMGDFNYEGYIAFIKDKLFGEGVDLCCGTGKITMRLSEDHPMIGVDSSIDMLNQAVDSSKKFKGKNLVWINEDVTEFTPNHPIDFAVCVCDGFNYLDRSQLEKTFEMVASYIKQGGKFIFDISSYYKLKNVLGNNVFCEDTEDVTYIWSNYYDEEEDCVEMQLGFFETVGEDLYKRIDEEHIQYAYKQEYILDLLKDNWSVEVFDGKSFGEVKENTQRLLFVATRV